MIRVQLEPEGKFTPVNFNPKCAREMIVNMSGHAAVSSSKWISDDAGTQSITNDRRDIEPGSERKAEFYVTLDDGRVTTHETIIGNVLCTPCQEGLDKFMLTDVILFESCPVKIISIRKMDKKGCAALHFHSKLQVWKPEKGKPYAQALVYTGFLSNESNLYERRVQSSIELARDPTLRAKIEASANSLPMRS